MTVPGTAPIVPVKVVHTDPRGRVVDTDPKVPRAADSEPSAKGDTVPPIPRVADTDLKEREGIVPRVAREGDTDPNKVAEDTDPRAEELPIGVVLDPEVLPTEAILAEGLQGVHL